jgi:excisionase family DNA binding protein
MPNPQPDREWFGLRELTRYSSVSERTLRGWISAPSDPLPAVKPGGKILVRRSDFDSWLGRRRIQPLDGIDINGIVREVLEGVGSGR